MADFVMSRDGDTADLIAFRERGRTAEVTEKILDLNPGLAELGPALPAGVKIMLPEPIPTKTVRDVPRIWS